MDIYNIPFVNISEEEYGLVFDFNVVSRIQNKYGTLSRWATQAFGEAAVSKISDETVKSQVSLLLKIIDGRGHVIKGYESRAKEILNKLADMYYLPVYYKQDKNLMIIEEPLYLSEWYCGHKNPERKKKVPKVKELLRVFGFLVNEYVDIYNDNPSNLKKPKLSDRQLGRLQLSVISKAVLQSIDRSFDTAKGSKPAGMEDTPINIAEVCVFATSKLGLTYKDIGRITPKFFNELCHQYANMVGGN